MHKYPQSADRTCYKTNSEIRYLLMSPDKSFKFIANPAEHRWNYQFAISLYVLAGFARGYRTWVENILTNDGARYQAS